MFKISVVILLLFAFSLHASEKLTVLANHEPPTNYFDPRGSFTGPSTDIVREIIKQLELNIEIQVLPWARILHQAKQQPNIITFTAGKSPERVNFGFHFIGPIFTRKQVIYKRKGTNLAISSLSDIKNQNLLVGGMRADWRTTLLINSGIRTQVTSLHEQNAFMLRAGRIDLWITSDLEAPFIIGASGDLNLLNEIELAYTIKESSGYIMISKGTSASVIKRWRDTFSDLQETNFFNSLAEKWNKELQLELIYSKEKGFHNVSR